MFPNQLTCHHVEKNCPKGAFFHFEMFRFTPVNIAANGALKIIDNSRKYLLGTSAEVVRLHARP